MVIPESYLMHGYGYNDYLSHHGVMGMRWGVRRYQNDDGSMTARGKAHYAQEGYRLANGGNRKAGKAAYEKASESQRTKMAAKQYNKAHEELHEKARQSKMNRGKQVGKWLGYGFAGSLVSSAGLMLGSNGHSVASAVLLGAGTAAGVASSVNMGKAILGAMFDDSSMEIGKQRVSNNGKVKK